ncbi:hypothetical protein [Uliginosibacterium gangwonense]|uniref:pectate lyase family protein n=1 Tax=Uliginosibacterium gangwonense TaxID=392736 RepID=UPI001B7F7BA7|nr:hypothetical protein [Uliginosibacterium gangwonense]
MAFASNTGGYATATGGGSAAEQTASTMAAIQSIIDKATGPVVIRYTGNQDADIKAAQADVCGQWKKAAREVVIDGKSDVTIIGADGSSANFGIRIKGASSNVIVRNMKIGMLPGGSSNGDIFGVEGSAKNIWIDHNEMFSRNVEEGGEIWCAGTPGNDTAFDGVMDMKSNIDNITISYNYIHDHHKVGLDGSSDTDLSKRHITFHHNYYSNVGARIPLQRGGFTHEYNNIYSGVTTSGINVRMGGQALIEGNWFVNTKNIVTSRDSSKIGYWDLRNNNVASASDFGTYGIKWTACSGTCKDATDWTTTKAFPSAEMTYTYTPDTATCVKNNLPAVAGQGKGLKTLTCK